MHEGDFGRDINIIKETRMRWSRPSNTGSILSRRELSFFTHVKFGALSDLILRAALNGRYIFSVNPKSFEISLREA